MNEQIIESGISQAQAAESPLVHNMAALAFGILLILGVGFLPMAAAHNAAHDTRHTLAFPCH